MVSLNNNAINILLIGAGVVLLLFSLGIFACALRTLLIIVAVGMLATGFIRGGYWNKLKGIIQK